MKKGIEVTFQNAEGEVLGKTDGLPGDALKVLAQKAGVQLTENCKLLANDAEVEDSLSPFIPARQSNVCMRARTAAPRNGRDEDPRSYSPEHHCRRGTGVWRGAHGFRFHHTPTLPGQAAPRCRAVRNLHDACAPDELLLKNMAMIGLTAPVFTNYASRGEVRTVKTVKNEYTVVI
jgi:hypothetical protein